MKCLQCGKTLAEDDRFCSGCGSRVEEPDPFEGVTADAAEDLPSVGEFRDTEPVSVTKSRIRTEKAKKVMKWLMWIFLALFVFGFIGFFSVEVPDSIADPGYRSAMTLQSVLACGGFVSLLAFLIVAISHVLVLPACRAEADAYDKEQRELREEERYAKIAYTKILSSYSEKESADVYGGALSGRIAYGNDAGAVVGAVDALANAKSVQMTRFLIVNEDGGRYTHAVEDGSYAYRRYIALLAD